ncbi:MAG: 4-hydroxythreonine-4-phosphate dehydrogenase PdxA [Zetaproteobacteria bacterium]|nr:MAG: 4-hydroxythreonine-4-phosphate dehydrogenase PdxA [Zetaproteobacteria bacterium]
MSKPLLLTLGEPAGIGPDCVLRAWQAEPQQFDDVRIVAPAYWLSERSRLVGIQPSIAQSCDWSAARAQADLHCWNPVSAYGRQRVVPGQPTPATAPMVVDCIRQAALKCLRREARALITAPIEKAVLRTQGFAFPGHTEFLAELAGNPPFAMMLASHQLRVALLTTHLALRAVPDALSVDQTLATLRVVDCDLRRRFRIAHPHLALCALNPHAGEQGHFGHEERDILRPAVREARSLGIDVTGPIAADTLFTVQQRTRFDAIVCCYHDQGLIPLKTLSFGEAVNITLGLPFVRTSVDHGTAVDKVGTDGVRHESLLAAIEMARQLTEQA